MRFVDLVGLALAAFHRQKVRTLLTTLGVVFGSFVLAASLSIRQGVHETIVREYSRHGQLRQIIAYSNYAAGDGDVPPEKLEIRGTMSEAKRERLRREIKAHWQGRGKPDPHRLLMRERLADLAARDHVQAVEPIFQQAGYARLDGHSEHAQIAAALADDGSLRQRLVAGEYLDPNDDRGVLVSEYLLYQLGVVDDADVERVPGVPLRWEVHARPSPGMLVTLVRGSWQHAISADEEKLLAHLVDRLPEALAKLDLTPEERAAAGRLLRPPDKPPTQASIVEDFTIRGVFRGAGPDDTQRNLWQTPNVDLIAPVQTGARLYEKSPAYREMAYHSVRITVDDMTNVKEVVKYLESQGLSTYSLAEFVEREQFTYRLIFSAMTVVAVVSLAVAALGITNTMLMGVLERVREIGIMKAVGARDGHVQLMFLVEGCLVGFAGGCLGLLLGWAASFPADSWVRATVQTQASIQLEASIFVFPAWLVVGVPLFACGVTTLAAYYPARRAARVNPIAALRHD